jgi:NAD(P)-dependent dehydrogenase (short-subunit alcohol dehydrogenase family)
MTALPQTPSFRLEGKRAVVTGAGRGIGAAMAAALAEAGAEVSLVARSEDEIEALETAILSSGGSAEAHALDVSDITAVRAFFGAQQPFDILINNAGTNRPKPITEVTEADFDAVFNLNVRAAYFVAQACVEQMIKAKKGGSLIHISSQMGHVGGPNRSLYCGSKWALEGMSKAMALDLAAHDIRSNTIAPTFIETPLTKPFFEDPAFKASVLSKIKLGRLGAVEDLMGAVVFLASDAARLMTGTSLVVDGGWTAE